MTNQFKNNPGQKFYARDVNSQADKDFISEMGGHVRYCPDCNTYDSPNSPCACGAYVILNHGKFWGRDENNEGGAWVDELHRAVHFYPGDKETLAYLMDTLRATYGGSVYTRRWGNKMLKKTCEVCGESYDWYFAPKGDMIAGVWGSYWSCGSTKCHEKFEKMGVKRYTA